MPRKRHHALKSLKIEDVFAGFEVYILPPLLCDCSSKLHEFDTPHTGCFLNEQVRVALSGLGISLNNLGSKDLPVIAQDSEVADTIGLFSIAQVYQDH